MSLQEYKKSREERLSALNKEIDKLSTKYAPDERFWRPEVDKTGKAAAVIRFLDSPKGEALPYARLMTHNFKGPGGLYIQNCLLTIGKPDPCNDLNRQLWATQIKENQNRAREQKIKVRFISNVLVIKDPKHPENEGKVFLYGYGKKIFEKINAMIHPEDDGVTKKVSVNPFDFYEGCNFILRAKTVDKYLNYDSSEFEAPSALFDGNDELIEQVYNKQHSLAQFTDLKNFKSYDELKKILDRIVGLDLKPTPAIPKKITKEVEADLILYTQPEEVTDISDDDLDLESLSSLAEEE